MLDEMGACQLRSTVILMLSVFAPPEMMVKDSGLEEKRPVAKSKKNVVLET